ncbi:MAG: RNA 2',3'-cyclic phosphodiesterase [Caulobacteraceae bacterium]
MIRLFAALAVPDEIAERLADLQHGLPGARWRPPETLHLTLRFMGEVTETTADDLDAELAAISAPAFDLGLGGVGSFGDAAVVRAVWAGARPSEPLRRLAGRCETAARRAGLKAERRPWRPHVTLAYLAAVDPASVARWLQGHNLWTSAAFRVGRFGLYSSRRGGGGSSYRLERSYRLG